MYKQADTISHKVIVMEGRVLSISCAYYGMLCVGLIMDSMHHEPEGQIVHTVHDQTYLVYVQ